MPTITTAQPTTVRERRPSGIALNRTARARLGAALALGVLGDALLNDAVPGINLALLVLALVGAVALFAARTRRLTAADGWLMAVALFFAAMVAVRASPPLVLLNIAGCLSALTLLAGVQRARGRWRPDGALFRDYAAVMAQSAGYGIAAAPMAVAAARRERPLVGRPLRAELATGARAVLLTAPLVLIFAALLSAADPVFGRLLQPAIMFDVDAVRGHVFLAGVLGWLSAGYLHGALGGGRPVRVARHGIVPQLGIVEVGAALASLDALFALFVVVQIRYLFGGDAGLQVAGLSYAEYARRGFFELVWVTALVLPVLLVSRELLGRATARAVRWYRALGGLTLVLVLMIVASAMLRMRMYQAEFGLTHLRLYTMVFMGWIVAVLGLFALTVLQGRRRGLAFGALASGWAALAALDVVNVDALIVRVNADRIGGARPFDAAYVSELSADAAPALARVYARLADPDERCQVVLHLTDDANRNSATDWRGWNAGRWQAERVAETDAVRAAQGACERRQAEQAARGRPAGAPAAAVPGYIAR